MLARSGSYKPGDWSFLQPEMSLLVGFNLQIGEIQLYLSMKQQQD